MKIGSVIEWHNRLVGVVVALDPGMSGPKSEARFVRIKVLDKYKNKLLDFNDDTFPVLERNCRVIRKGRVAADRYGRPKNPETLTNIIRGMNETSKYRSERSSSCMV